MSRTDPRLTTSFPTGNSIKIGIRRAISSVDQSITGEWRQNYPSTPCYWNIKTAKNCLLCGVLDNDSLMYVFRQVRLQSSTTYKKRQCRKTEDRDDDRLNTAPDSCSGGPGFRSGLRHRLSRLTYFRGFQLRPDLSGHASLHILSHLLCASSSIIHIHTPTFYLIYSSWFASERFVHDNYTRWQLSLWSSQEVMS